MVATAIMSWIMFCLKNTVTSGVRTPVKLGEGWGGGGQKDHVVVLQQGGGCKSGTFWVIFQVLVILGYTDYLETDHKKKN